MRTHILIATLLLSASAADAGTRGLSGPQANPVDAPAYQVQSVAQPTETAKAAEQPPLQSAPVQAAPIAAQPVEATPAQAGLTNGARPAEATVASEAQEERPVRRNRERRLTLEQRADREFRKIERRIQRHIGNAFAGAFTW